MPEELEFCVWNWFQRQTDRKNTRSCLAALRLSKACTTSWRADVGFTLRDKTDVSDDNDIRNSTWPLPTARR